MIKSKFFLHRRYPKNEEIGTPTVDSQQREREGCEPPPSCGALPLSKPEIEWALHLPW